MPEKTETIWTRPLRGALPRIAAFAILGAVVFLIVLAFGALAGLPGNPQNIVWFALRAGIIAGVLSPLVLIAFGWLRAWRNLRRVLFAVACLVTLIALVWAEENWRGKHAWQKFVREARANGNQLTITELMPPPVPDEKNLALAPLLKPFFDYENGDRGIVWRDTNGQARVQKVSSDLPSEHRSNDHPVLGSIEQQNFADLDFCAEFYRANTNFPQAPANAPKADVVLTALNKFAPELSELRQAAATRPYSRFPIHYTDEPAWSILLPHLAPLKGLNIFIQLRATAELEAGRPADAFEDLKLGFRLADSIRDEVLLIDQLVRENMLMSNLQVVRDGLHRHAWTDAQLSELETNLAAVNILADYRKGMSGERALAISGLDWLRRQSWRNNPMNYLADDEESSRTGWGFNIMFSGWFYQNMVLISRMHDQYLLACVDESAHRVFRDKSLEGQRAFVELGRGPYTILARLLLPALGKAVQKFGRNQTYADAARVACALERYRLAHGALPDNLEALTPQFLDKVPNDIMDGKPLRYHRTSDGGYTLYSVGWNQTDDGGQLVRKPGPKEATIDLTQGDWVWQMPPG